MSETLTPNAVINRQKTRSSLLRTKVKLENALASNPSPSRFNALVSTLGEALLQLSIDLEYAQKHVGSYAFPYEQEPYVKMQRKITFAAFVPLYEFIQLKTRGPVDFLELKSRLTESGALQKLGTLIELFR